MYTQADFSVFVIKQSSYNGQFFLKEKVRARKTRLKKPVPVLLLDLRENMAFCKWFQRLKHEGLKWVNNRLQIPTSNLAVTHCLVRFWLELCETEDQGPSFCREFKTKSKSKLREVNFIILLNIWVNACMVKCSFSSECSLSQRK